MPPASAKACLVLWGMLAAAPGGGAAGGGELEAATRRDESQAPERSPDPAPVKALSKQETEALVKADLAARLKVAAEAVETLRSSRRTWSDQRLGCSARKGLEEPTPVPGYEFTVAHAGQEFVYHTDQRGTLVRCTRPAKVLGPVAR